MTISSDELMSSTIISLVSDLRRDEGQKDRPYRDSRGFLTIGIGHNLDASGLCEEAIDAQLKHDLSRTFAEMDLHLPWWREHPSEVQRVLANLWFNIGSGLLKWPVTLGHIHSRAYTQAANDIRSNTVYVKQVGQRAARLAALLDIAGQLPSEKK